MEDSEKNWYIEFLIQQKEERDKTIAEKDTFIKNLFAAIAAGRTDYENMLPMTLGVCKAA